MMPHTSEFLKSEILSALAHPNRIRILEFLADGPQCGCDIGPPLEIEQSNLSRHLGVLVRAGILTAVKEGLRVNFKIADMRVLRILDLAAELAKKSVERKIEALKEA